MSDLSVYNVSISKTGKSLGFYYGELTDIIAYIAKYYKVSSLKITKFNVTEVDTLPRPIQRDLEVVFDLSINEEEVNDVVAQLRNNHAVELLQCLSNCSGVLIKSKGKEITWTPNLLGPIDTAKAKTLGALLKEGRTLLCKMEDGTEVTIFQEPGKNDYDYNIKGSEDLNIIELLTASDVKHNRQTWYDITE